MSWYVKAIGLMLLPKFARPTVSLCKAKLLQNTTKYCPTGKLDFTSIINNPLRAHLNPTVVQKTYKYKRTVQSAWLVVHMLMPDCGKLKNMIKVESDTMVVCLQLLKFLTIYAISTSSNNSLMRIRCMILYGLILMIVVVGVSHQAVLDIHSSRIKTLLPSLAHLIIVTAVVIWISPWKWMTPRTIHSLRMPVSSSIVMMQRGSKICTVEFSLAMQLKKEYADRHWVWQCCLTSHVKQHVVEYCYTLIKSELNSTICLNSS